MDFERLKASALAAGFTNVAPLDPATIELKDEVRAMCSANTCGAYGRNWSCPPACGELDALRREISAYREGILVQTVGEIEDSFDAEGIMAAQAAHQAHFVALNDALREIAPDRLALSAGTCRQCEVCAYPDAPCRFPDRRFSSMEAYGMLVLEVCKRNGLKYYYGPGAIAYTGCFLFK